MPLVEFLIVNYRLISRNITAGPRLWLLSGLFIQSNTFLLEQLNWFTFLAVVSVPLPICQHRVVMTYFSLQNCYMKNDTSFLLCLSLGARELDCIFHLCIVLQNSRSRQSFLRPKLRTGKLWLLLHSVDRDELQVQPRLKS